MGREGVVTVRELPRQARLFRGDSFSPELHGPLIRWAKKFGVGKRASRLDAARTRSAQGDAAAGPKAIIGTAVVRVATRTGGRWATCRVAPEGQDAGDASQAGAGHECTAGPAGRRTTLGHAQATHQIIEPSIS